MKVSLKPGETVTEVIKLDPIKQGNITGKVVDKATNTAIANATVKVLEDSNIESVITDEEGNFTINEVFAGDYTLRVMSRDFYTENINVTVEGEKDNLVNVAMRKFVGVEDEIAYDDGTSEDARVFVNAGVGFGVRFTPKSYGRVKEANIFFVNNHKKALGNKIGISIVYIDKKGKISEVGDLKEVTIERGKWNKIDLLDYDFATDKDFYIVTKQLYPAAQSPAIGIDKDSLENERSYVYTGGLTPIADYEIGGAMMIRAIMDYEVEAPKEEVTTPNITNLKKLNYTNKDNIILEGNMNIEGKVNVFVNDEKVTTVDTENKLFSANIQVKEGENNITISGEADGKTSKMSSIIKVIGDTTSPEVTIEVPVDSDLINKATIEITGNAKDDNLKNVTVNEKEVIVDEKGNFNISIPAVSGENIITAIATDLAENQTTVTKKVNVVNATVTTPEITNLKEVNYINTDTVTLEGKMNVEGSVNVFVNGEKVAAVETKDKLFTATLDLKEEVNIITISGEKNGVTTEMSEKVKVIVDKTLPEVTVEVPKDMDVVNKDSIEITGNAKDNNLKNVTVNEEEVYLDEDGNFKIILPVVMGENTIKVVATDLAGNETVVTKKVTITKETKIPETEDPVIKEPKDDKPKVDVPKTDTPKAETPKASGPKTTTTKTKLVKTGSLVNTSSMMLLGISLIIGGYIFIRKQKK
nr:carboxypeptidase regulatory-like domain-containing protein [Clostridium algidicarnis]